MGVRQNILLIMTLMAIIYAPVCLAQDQSQPQSQPEVEAKKRAFGNGVNLQPSYGSTDLNWDLMKESTNIKSVRIEIEPDKVEEAKKWISEASANGYDVIATYHDHNLVESGTDKAEDLNKAAEWWKTNYDALSGEGKNPFTINVMNEWGTHSITADQYAEAYNGAISTIREVYKGDIIADVPGWGQELNTAASASASITDPNVIFSAHLYSAANQGASQGLTPADLDNLAATGRQFMIGEFGDVKGVDKTDVTAMVNYAKQLGAPVMGWAWNGDGGDMNMVSNEGGVPGKSQYFNDIYNLLASGDQNATEGIEGGQGVKNGSRIDRKILLEEPFDEEEEDNMQGEEEEDLQGEEEEDLQGEEEEEDMQGEEEEDMQGEEEDMQGEEEEDLQGEEEEDLQGEEEEDLQGEEEEDMQREEEEDLQGEEEEDMQGEEEEDLQGEEEEDLQGEEEEEEDLHGEEEEEEAPQGEEEEDLHGEEEEEEALQQGEEEEEGDQRPEEEEDEHSKDPKKPEEEPKQPEEEPKLPEEEPKQPEEEPKMPEGPIQSEEPKQPEEEPNLPEEEPNMPEEPKQPEEEPNLPEEEPKMPEDEPKMPEEPLPLGETMQPEGPQQQSSDQEQADIPDDQGFLAIIY